MAYEIAINAGHTDIQRWQESMADRFLPLTLKNAGATFRMSARVGMAEDLRFARVQTSAIRVDRSSALARRAEGDCYKILFQLAGQSRVEQANASLTLSPGQWAIYDATRPYAIECSDQAHFVAMLAPPTESATWRWFVDRSSTTPRQTVGNARLALETIGYFLAGQVPDDAQSVAGFRQATLALLESVIRREASDTLANTDPRSGALRLRAESLIAKHFSDPELTPERLAAALNVSRRTLYNAFASRDETPQALIQEYRLQASRRALEDPLDRSRNLIELATASGFSDGTHFGRAFKQRFGCTPSAWRARSQATIDR